MAVVLCAYDLIARIADLPDGVEAFVRAVPNRTFCTDGQIVIASFMRLDDREAFARSLALPVCARADLRTRSTDAEWLECGRYGGVDAVWLKGVSAEPLVVPIGWKPGALMFGTWDDMKEHLEYLGREGNVEVYRDKRTGQKLYLGRTQPSLPPAEVERIEKLRKEANELIGSIGEMRPLGFFEKRTVKKGIALLEKILEITPGHWATLWTMGMALRKVDDQKGSLEKFRLAYSANPNHPDVGREYAGQCLRVGAGEEGVRIAREVHTRFPDDVWLHANLAIAMLIGGDLNEALQVALAALARDPSDQITKNLVDHIRKVIAGAEPRPTRLPGT